MRHGGLSMHVPAVHLHALVAGAGPHAAVGACGPASQHTI